MSLLDKFAPEAAPATGPTTSVGGGPACNLNALMGKAGASVGGVGTFKPADIAGMTLCTDAKGDNPVTNTNTIAKSGGIGYLVCEPMFDMDVEGFALTGGSVGAGVYVTGVFSSDPRKQNLLTSNEIPIELFDSLVDLGVDYDLKRVEAKKRFVIQIVNRTGVALAATSADSAPPIQGILYGRCACNEAACNQGGEDVDGGPVFPIGLTLCSDVLGKTPIVDVGGLYYPAQKATAYLVAEVDYRVRVRDLVVAGDATAFDIKGIFANGNRDECRVSEDNVAAEFFSFGPDANLGGGVTLPTRSRRRGLNMVPTEKNNRIVVAIQEMDISATSEIYAVALVTSGSRNQRCD